MDKTIFSEKLWQEIEEYQKNIIAAEKVDIKNSFNIFTAISDSWHLENWHSKILKLILDPSSRLNYGSLFLDIFVELVVKKIAEKNPGIKKPVFSKVEVSTEKQTDDGRADIYIHDLVSNDIVVIENKLHSAGDMPEQLPRYYTYAKDHGNPIALVYLPLYFKEPPFESYSTDKNIIEEMKKITVVIDAMTLASGFLDVCLDKIERNTIAYFFIKHYSNLLKSLGGNQMIIENEKAIVAKMMECTDNFEAFERLGTIWGKRADIAGEIIMDVLKDCQFIQANRYICEKKLSENVSLVFKSTDDGYFIVGVSCNADDKPLRNELEKILTDSRFDNLKKVEYWEIRKGEICIHRKFDFHKYRGFLNELESFLIERFNALESAVKDILRN